TLFRSHVAVSAFAACKNHTAASDGLHGRANRCAVIRAEMRAIGFQDWMEARLAEMRRHGCTEFQRRSQESLLKAFAIRRVVGRPSLRIVKQQRLIFSATVDIFRGENLAIARRFAIAYLRFSSTTRNVSP